MEDLLLEVQLQLQQQQMQLDDHNDSIDMFQDVMKEIDQEQQNTYNKTATIYIVARAGRHYHGGAQLHSEGAEGDAAENRAGRIRAHRSSKSSVSRRSSINGNSRSSSSSRTAE